jgi:hypothetical protein
MLNRHRNGDSAAHSPAQGLVAALVICVALLPVSLRAADGDAADRRKDPRLGQRVTARIVEKPLRTWLQELSRQTGVRLRTAADYEDRAITVRVSDMALGDLMDEVAALYRDAWLPRGKKEAPEYVLEASRGRRERQRRLHEAFQQGLQAELTGLVEEVATRGAPPWLLEGGQDDEGYAEQMQARARVLSHLSPEAVSRLLGGERMRVRMADVRGPGGDALWSFAERFAMPDAAGWKAQDRANAWVELYSQSYTSRRPGMAGLPLRDLRFALGTGSTASSTYNLVVHPDQLAARLQPALDALQQGERQDAAERRRRGGKALTRVVPNTSEFAAGAHSSRSEVLAALADAVELNLISDSHVKPPRPSPAIGGRVVEDALDAVGETYHCDWRVEKSAILVRSRFWWLDDLAEPPATALTAWQARLEADKVLLLDHAAQIGALSPDQQARVALRLPEASPAFSSWFRLYAQMSRTQREAAASPRGLPFWKLSEAQRHLLLVRGAHDFSGLVPAGETIDAAAAILKVREETSVRIGNRTVPRAVTFSLEPVAGVTGRPLVQGMKATLPLPYRAADKPTGPGGGLPGGALPGGALPGGALP